MSFAPHSIAECFTVNNKALHKRPKGPPFVTLHTYLLWLYAVSDWDKRAWEGTI